MTSIRALDPVDPAAQPPDGSHLLETVLDTPRPSRLRRRGVRLLQLVPVGLAVAFVAGAAAVVMSASSGDGGRDEQEVTSGFGGASLIRYAVRESYGSPDGSRHPVASSETWQLADGSRSRTVSHWLADGPLHGTTTEDALTRTLSLAYRPGSQGHPATIIRYRRSDDFDAIHEEPPPFGAPPIGGSAEVGDPRTLPDRLAAGDKDVAQLPDATVRGIAVKQFRVGRCHAAGRDAQGVVALPQRAIVAIARDTLAPVRVTEELCPQITRLGSRPDDTAGAEESRILDYASFEELPATPENLDRLELSPHPGVKIVDGIEIDKQEDRADTPRAPTPTPGP
jgi:hypothetical protein